MKDVEKMASRDEEKEDVSLVDFTIIQSGPPEEFPPDNEVIYFRTRGTTDREGDYLSLNSSNRFILEEHTSSISRWRLHFTTSGGQNAGYKFEHVHSGLFMVLNDDGELITSSTSNGYWQMWKYRRGPCVRKYSMRWLARNSASPWLVVINNGSVSVQRFEDIDKCRASWDWQAI